MGWIAAKTKWIMLVAGILTCTMLYAALAPRAALLSSFGAALEGPVADVVVRNWGVLVALVGAMLIYGAFDAPSRRLALVVAIASKITFIGLVLSHGQQFLGHQAGLAIVVDAVLVPLLALCLSSSRRAPAAV